MPTRSRQTVARALVVLSAALLTAGSGNAFANDTNTSSAAPSSAFRFPAFLTSPTHPARSVGDTASVVPDATRLTLIADRFSMTWESPTTLHAVERPGRVPPASVVNSSPADDSESAPTRAVDARRPDTEELDRLTVAPTTSPSLLGRFVQRAGNVAGEVVASSLSMIGVRYRWGGTTPSRGLDCSGFVQYVFQDTLGLQLPRRAEDMARTGHKVALSELQPGDLVFFNTMRRTFSHVGIYLGDNRFIHAPRTGERVRVDTMDDGYWERRFTGARRVATSALVASPLARAIPVDYTPTTDSMPSAPGHRVSVTLPGPTGTDTP